jgi:hypothetical protein
MRGVSVRLDRDVSDFVVWEQVAIEMIAVVVVVDVGVLEELGYCLGWKLYCTCASSWLSGAMCSSDIQSAE